MVMRRGKPRRFFLEGMERMAEEFYSKYFIALLLSFFWACAHYPVNQPVTELGPAEGYIPQLAKIAENKSDDILFIMAFSGGGTRAASLAYGVMRGLDQVAVPSEKP